MFVFAFEGVLLAFTYNGDRFVLLALLPRRKPRTDGSVQPPYHSVIELNLTSSRLLRFACTLWRLAWISVSSVRCRTSTLCCRFLVWGLPDKKPSPPHHRDDLGFRFSTRRPPCGGMGAFAFARRARQSRAVFVFGPRHALAVYVFFFGRVTRFARDGCLR